METERGGRGSASPHKKEKKKRRKENKRNPADKSRIVLAFIWTCGGARLRLNPNETAACPEWIHHRWIGVISPSAVLHHF